MSQHSQSFTCPDCGLPASVECTIDDETHAWSLTFRHPPHPSCKTVDHMRSNLMSGAGLRFERVKPQRVTFAPGVLDDDDDERPN